MFKRIISLSVFLLVATVSYGAQDVRVGVPTSGGKYRIYTNNSGSVGDRVTILSDGKTGIGTSTPISPLEVSGNATGLSITQRTAGFDLTTVSVAQADNQGLYAQIIEGGFNDNGHTGLNHFGLGVIGTYDSKAIQIDNASTDPGSVGMQINQTVGDGLQVNTQGGYFSARFFNAGSGAQNGIWVSDASSSNFTPILLQNSTHFLGLKMAATGTSWDMTLPGTVASNGQFLRSNASGVTSWSYVPGLDAHMKSTQTTAPSATPNANLGTGGTCTLNSGATDTVGEVTLTAGAAGSSGAQCAIGFFSVYGAAPKCQLTPTNAASSLGNIYVSETASALTINSAVVPVNTTVYAFNYSCIETN